MAGGAASDELWQVNIIITKKKKKDRVLRLLIENDRIFPTYET